MSARDQLESARKTYDTAGKNLARAVVVDIAQEMKALTILDLWGTGESARAFRTAIHDSAVVSAETKQEMWPVLLRDAQEHGYVPHLGDVTSAPGTYDLIWLDFCGPASKPVATVIEACRKKLAPGGRLAITIMPAREQEPLISGYARLRHLPMWLEEQAKLATALLLPYRRDNGLPMWLVVLDEYKKSWFDDGQLFRSVEEDLSKEGYWSRPSKRRLLSWQMFGLLDIYGGFASKPDRPTSRGRTVRLEDLTPPQRRLVLALIDAEKDGKERRLASEWAP